MTKLYLGPVLSFRGGVEKGIWKVTSLIAVDSHAPFPIITLDGKATSAPTILLEHRGKAFLRYDLSCKQQKEERKAEYRIAGIDEAWHFTVPARGDAPRMVYLSCNGFSDANGIRKLIKGENAVWEDLLCNHDKTVRPKDYRLDKEQLWHETHTHNKGLQRFHLMVMGGDQIYFDPIWEDIKLLKKWIGLPRKEQLKYTVSAALEKKIEDYYIDFYLNRWLPSNHAPWGSNKKTLDSAHGMARIPTIMMWDDHDIFDGWGSHSPEMQRSPLFQRLFYHARRAFWIFQMQQAADQLPELKLRSDLNMQIDDPIFEPIKWSDVLKSDKLALPLFDNQPGFSFGHNIGPVSLLVSDLRTERSHRQIMGPSTWKAMQKWLSSEIPAYPNDRHLLFVSSVPVMHPKLSLAEILMDNLGYDHVLDSSADDLKDHWTNDDHEGERKRLIENLFKTAQDKQLRVTVLSGDVHVAAWGVVNRTDLSNCDCTTQIQQLTSSAIVHPSLVSVMERLFCQMLNTLAKKKQKLDIHLEAEMMLFPGSNRYIMPARNWLALELDSNPNGRKLWASWRCETKDTFTNHLLAIDSLKR
ncbi:alkaline phosphatase D family protein [Neisseria weaveri]|uniref:alkaline phosphatase D family protein n=1 Tax=Neisseria weaveri TaxID=28091 RepID=UPI000D30B200|nr:alkaline phosphatase D family protein [Neisseria weaveri]